MRTIRTLGAALVILAVPTAAQEAPGQNPPPLPQLFQHSGQCIACHNHLTTPTGADVSIGFDWRGSMMANAARDPYWQAAVRRETLDHPAASDAIQDECSKCHMPMARYTAHAGGGEGRIFAHLPLARTATPLGPLAADGVSCSMCHQIQPENLGTEESFVGGFEVDERTPLGARKIYGPYDVDQGRTTLMRSSSRFEPARGDHIQDSDLCATCHTLITHALGEDGEVIGELPEQVPYQEWLHSGYRDERSCQSCHMPAVDDSVAISGVLGQPRAGFNRHVFRGGNFFMMRILNRYRDELGVTALPQELDASVSRTLEHLKSRAARLKVEEPTLSEGRLRVGVAVENLAGHKLPTAYPSRRAWIHLTVRDASGTTVFESGALEPTGAITGNDNDADPRRYERHYDEIDGPDQVQIYEAIMVGPDDRVTTGLLTAVRFIKDNRVLPDGFDKTTAHEDVAVHGRALDDRSFSGGRDRVRYAVDVGDAAGPFTVEAELWYQPIGFRWARNLQGRDSFETRRFVGYYDAMSKASGVVLARDEVTVR